MGYGVATKGLIGAFAALLLFTCPATARPLWHLTVEGLGPVRIGMTERQASNALRTRWANRATPADQACIERQAAALPGVTFMFESRRLTRISLEKPSRIATPRGITVGARDAQVRRAYGAALKVEKTKYEPPPAAYLTYWVEPGKRGVRFETGTDRRVDAIHAGGESITYVEGCA